MPSVSPGYWYCSRTVSKSAEVLRPVFGPSGPSSLPVVDQVVGPTWLVARSSHLYSPVRGSIRIGAAAVGPEGVGLWAGEVAAVAAPVPSASSNSRRPPAMCPRSKVFPQMPLIGGILAAGDQRHPEDVGVRSRSSVHLLGPVMLTTPAAMRVRADEAPVLRICTFCAIACGSTLRSNDDTAPRVPARPARRPLEQHQRAGLGPPGRASRFVCAPGPPAVTKFDEMAEVIWVEPAAIGDGSAASKARLNLPSRAAVAGSMMVTGSGLLKRGDRANARAVDGSDPPPVSASSAALAASACCSSAGFPARARACRPA